MRLDRWKFHERVHREQELTERILQVLNSRPFDFEKRLKRHAKEAQDKIMLLPALTNLQRAADMRSAELRKSGMTKSRADSQAMAEICTEQPALYRAYLDESEHACLTSAGKRAYLQACQAHFERRKQGSTLSPATLAALPR